MAASDESAAPKHFSDAMKDELERVAPAYEGGEENQEVLVF